VIRVQVMTGHGAMLRGLVRARAVILFLAVVISCLASPRQQLAGIWQGEGMPVVSFLPHAALPIEICIGENSLSGRVGDATIVSGEVARVPAGITRWFVHADYEITLKLEGELLQGTGIRRKEFRLYVTPDGAGLRAFAASDGSMCFPWSSQEALRKSMMVQTLPFTLKKMPQP
jgi:hypothetical protein